MRFTIHVARYAHMVIKRGRFKVSIVCGNRGRETGWKQTYYIHITGAESIDWSFRV